LLALIDDQDARAVMDACSVDVEALRKTVLDYVDNELDNLVTGYDEDAKPTAGSSASSSAPSIHVQSSGREEVTGANVLVAIFAERESHAAYFLQEQDMTRYDAVNTSPWNRQAPGRSSPRPPEGAEEQGSGRRPPKARRQEKAAGRARPIASTSTRKRAAARSIR
jgi:ATP-dependent Clp protease ATP-binding subunit ClpA